MLYTKYGGKRGKTTPQLGIGGPCQGVNLKKYELFKVVEA